MLTAILAVYIILVVASFCLFRDRPWRPRIFTALVWPLICLGIGLFVLALWFLALPEKLG